MHPLRAHLRLAIGLPPLALAACYGRDVCEKEDCDISTPDSDWAETDVADTSSTDSDDTDRADTDTDTDTDDTDPGDTDPLPACDPAPDGAAHAAAGGSFDGSAVWRVCWPIPASDPGCLPVGTPGAPTAGDLLAALCQSATPDCLSLYAIYGVPCGPTDDGGACCYNVIAGPAAVIGRPFAAGDGHRTAAPAPVHGWGAPEAELPHDPVAAAAWTRHALGEHASVASFASFVQELLALGAPAELLRDAIDAMQDEVRHAELTFAIAAALAGRPVGPGPLPTADAARRSTPRDVLRAVIVEGCVGETVAAHDAAVRRDLGGLEPIRAAWSAIADDEARHAGLAWRTVRWLLERHPALREEADAAFTEAVAARRVADGTGEPHQPALGLHDDRAQAAAARVALDAVVTPLWRDLVGAITAANGATG